VISPASRGSTSRKTPLLISYRWHSAAGQQLGPRRIVAGQDVRVDSAV